MDECVVQNAMQIILHAGDARLKCKKALDYISNYDFINAKAMMKEVQADITKAHQLQTDAIRGEKKEYSLLFAHAQDTLMTVYSELNITKQMITIFESYEKRLQALESKG